MTICGMIFHSRSKERNCRPAAAASYDIQRNGGSLRFICEFLTLPPPLRSGERTKFTTHRLLHSHVGVCTREPDLFGVRNGSRLQTDMCFGGGVIFVVRQGTALVRILRKEFYPSFIEGQGMTEVSDVLHAGCRSGQCFVTNETNRRYGVPMDIFCCIT